MNKFQAPFSAKKKSPPYHIIMAFDLIILNSNEILTTDLFFFIFNPAVSDDNECIVNPTQH